MGASVSQSGLPTDVRVTGVELYLLPIETRMPLKFGPETLTTVTCARARVSVRGRDGRQADGWGETPLSVQWVWPSRVSYAERHQVLVDLTHDLAAAWAGFHTWGHPLEIGARFQRSELFDVLARCNERRPGHEAAPHLAALVCCSPFDLALYDAFGQLHQAPTYSLLSGDFLSHDLAHFLTPADDVQVDFRGQYPADYLQASPPKSLPAWHLVGGLDPLTADDLSGDEPSDGHPVLLSDWIERDGLQCLKVKLRGTDAAWDYERLAGVGRLAIDRDVPWLSTDFNCTVTEPAYVNDILDRLQRDQPQIFAQILYVEQPFPYDLEENRIDVHSVSERKPLFMDESAHDWRLVNLGRSLGWTGVALKTCKTQTGALLALCWAKAHGMDLMVQDLTNPMLAQIPHVLLAAHAGTIMGVETNAMQFYPDVSVSEAAVHPGLYQRRRGLVDLSTIRGAGFGYRVDEIDRTLGEPSARFGDLD